MKSRKTRVLVALGLVAVSGFLLVTSSFADDTKNIKLDAKNAVQTIPKIIFRSSVGTTGNQVEMTNVGNLIRIDTSSNNFVLSKTLNVNRALGSYSDILGGTVNHIDGESSNYSVIIAGDTNQINNSSYATIGGGKDDKVLGSYGTVMGGQGNTANAYATIVGGNKNVASGTYSVAVGNNNKANATNSVAMGSGATVNAANSFLWNDGTSAKTLGSNNTFAVVGGSGMAVNTETAHRFAQLTIGGSLIINQKSTDTSTCGPTTTGVVKVVNGSHGQTCFCSCNGSKRSSLYGGGDCSSKCDSAVTPECGTTLIKDCSSNPYSYSGSCKDGKGEVVEGTGAYMVDKDGKVHWTCQTNDGNRKSCALAVTSTNGTGCTEPDPEGSCSGGYDTDKATMVAGSDSGFTGIVNATLYNRLSDVPSGTKCAWYCKNEYYKKGDICAPMEGCDEFDQDGYHVPYLGHGETTTVTNDAGTCTRTAKCENGTGTLLPGETCYSCQGSKPTGATENNPGAKPAGGNKDYFCEAGSTAACSYTCPSGQECDGTTGCKDKPYGEVECGEENYTCEGTGATMTYNDDMSSTEFKWKCTSEDGKKTQNCSNSCPSGQTLTWSSLHNGSCVAACATRQECSDYGYSSYNGEGVDGCYQIMHLDDGCSGDLTCLAIGCTAIGYTGYTCVEADEVSAACVGAGGVKDEKQIDNDAYRCITCNGVEPVNIHNYKIYWSYSYNEEDSQLVYSMKVKNLDTNKYENLPIIVGLKSHYKINPRPGDASTPHQYDRVTLGENGNNGNYVGTVNVFTNPTNGISDIYLRGGEGDDTSWTERSGDDVYNITLEEISTVGECGSAHTTYSLDAPTDGLCYIGTATTPIESFGGGEPNGPVWEWTCDGSPTCYAHIPRATFECEADGDWSVLFTPVGVAPTTIGVSQSIYAGFNTVTMNVLMRYSCGDANVQTKNCTIEYGCYNPTFCGIFQSANSSCGMCDYNSQAEIHYVEIQSISPSTYNGYRLVAGGSCGSTPYSCQGNIPNGADLNNPSARPAGGNKDYFCEAGSTAACSYTCPSGQECDGTTGCKDKPYGEVECGEENYTCEGTGATMTYNDDMSSTEFKWKCTSEDGKKTQNCSNSCPSGQTLTWSSLHNGVCANEVVNFKVNHFIAGGKYGSYETSYLLGYGYWFSRNETNYYTGIRGDTIYFSNYAKPEFTEEGQAKYQVYIGGNNQVDDFLYGNVVGPTSMFSIQLEDGTNEINLFYDCKTGYKMVLSDDQSIGACVNDEPEPDIILCCPSVPEHGEELAEDEDVLDGSMSLCEPIIKANEEGSDEILEVDGDCWYEGAGGTHTNGCGWSKYCCLDSRYPGYGLEQISCTDLSESFCDDSIQGTIITGKKYDKFICEDGYHLDGCDCVADSVPININISCQVDYYKESDFDGGWVDGCAQTMWKSTSFTADNPVPTDIYIQQDRYIYGISTRDPNSCTFCHHPGSPSIVSYKIAAKTKEATSHHDGRMAGVSFYTANAGGIGFDAEGMNGVSSISLSSSDFNIEPVAGSIKNPVSSLTYTDDAGQQYNIVLQDCSDVHQSWLNSNPRIDSNGICTRGGNSGGNSGGGNSGGDDGGDDTQWQNVVLYNDTNRIIRLYNNSEYPFHFNDTSYNEDDEGCVGTTQACDLYLGPGWRDFGIEYEYCNQNNTFYAQSCREVGDMCGTLYPVNISCGTSMVRFNQSSATSS